MQIMEESIIMLQNIDYCDCTFMLSKEGKDNFTNKLKDFLRRINIWGKNKYNVLLINSQSDGYIKELSDIFSAGIGNSYFKVYTDKEEFRHAHSENDIAILHTMDENMENDIHIEQRYLGMKCNLLKFTTNYLYSSNVMKLITSYLYQLSHYNPAVRLLSYIGKDNRQLYFSNDLDVKQRDKFINVLKQCPFVSFQYKNMLALPDMNADDIFIKLVVDENSHMIEYDYSKQRINDIFDISDETIISVISLQFNIYNFEQKWLQLIQSIDNINNWRFEDNTHIYQ